MDLEAILRREGTPRAMRLSLATVAATSSLRCDAKQAERRFAALDEFLASTDTFTLDEVLPGPVVRGAQPSYVDEPEGAVPVISTACIRQLTLVVEACRYTASPDWGADGSRRPVRGDVLLTLDGGASIGKPLAFERDDVFAIDGHVAILRPEGIEAQLLALLLASPIGQAQFQRAEAGASGQTGVSEDDLRRFRFPRLPSDIAGAAVAALLAARAEAARLHEVARAAEATGWARFVELLVRTG